MPDTPATPHFEVVDDWETVAVTPMTPGWVIRVRDDTCPGGPTVHLWPCPALLTQRLRTSNYYEDIPDPTRPSGYRLTETVEHHPEPYQVRVIAAHVDGCELIPAEGENFTGLWGPGELDAAGGE